MQQFIAPKSPWITRAIAGLTVINSLMAGLGPAYSRSLAEIVESGYVNIFVYEDFPPFSFKDHEDLSGIDVDIGRLIAKGLGVEARFVTKTKSANVLRDAEDALNAEGGDKADLVMHVPDVAGQLIGTNISNILSIHGYYFRERLSLLIDPEAAEERDLAVFLRSERTGVLANTLAETYLTKLITAADGDQSLMVRFQTIAKAIEAFRSGEITGFYAIRSQAELTARSAGRPTGIAHPAIPGKSGVEWNVAIAVRRNASGLGDRVQTLIEKLNDDGTLSRIFAQSGITYSPAAFK